ncbi:MULTISPECIES: MFS transporter [Kitasatospora]|uniref:Putative major facilitator superfamily transporter n=1 Tax=Kitasatospora setae (strain ATCC 33774 / DSM 43861 / JCM 3304 / KCC A-0304 / NBRC 14216 / KM-6054) TaxID=452652 RepID=E4N1Q7_KITSK|nr:MULTISPECIES: MFS transporter [Kitasatospora]BAJ32091.1 putative major facilitator superfamily transporter [Kitasatospora setae KM-6054]
MTAAAAPAGRRSLLPADPVLRRLAVLTAVNTVGNGLYYSVSALYFTRQVGLSAAQLATGLACAGVAGMLAGVPFGRLADRVGHRRLLYLLGPLQGLAVLAYAVVDGFAAFVAAVVAATVLERGAVVVRSALIAHLLPVEDQVRSRALLRSVMNAGLVVGATGAAFVLHADSYWGYTAALAVDAATFAATSLLLTGLPNAAPVDGRPQRADRDGKRRRTALADRRYLLVAFLHAVLELQFAMLEIGIPLWIATRTSAPRPLVAVVGIVNCLAVVLFQVRASRGVVDLRSAARACARGGVLLGAACLVYAAAAGRGAVLAVVLVLAGVLLHSLAELLTSAGGWTLSLDLADPERHGEYQGVFMSGQAGSHVIGPLIVTATVLAHGVAGWAVLGGLLVAAGLAIVPAAARQSPEKPKTPQWVGSPSV